MPRKNQPTELNEYEKVSDFYVRCFEPAEGKAVLADLKATFQDKSTVPGTVYSRDIDPNWTHVAEGQRRVYLYIKQRIEEGLNARAGRNTGNAGADEPSIWDL